MGAPAGATVEWKVPGLGDAPALTELLPGQPVTVWTEPAAFTPQAQLGAPGALTAARVVLQSYS